MLWIPLNLFFPMILPAYSPLYVGSEAQQTVPYQITVSPVCAWVCSVMPYSWNETRELRALAPSRGRRELDTTSMRTHGPQPTGPLGPGSFLQASALRWGATCYSQGSSRPRDWPCVSCISSGILYHSTTWEALDSLSSCSKSSAKVRRQARIRQ